MLDLTFLSCFLIIFCQINFFWVTKMQKVLFLNFKKDKVQFLGCHTILYFFWLQIWSFIFFKSFILWSQRLNMVIFLILSLIMTSTELHVTFDKSIPYPIGTISKQSQIGIWKWVVCFIVKRVKFIIYLSFQIQLWRVRSYNLLLVKPFSV